MFRPLDALQIGIKQWSYRSFNRRPARAVRLAIPSWGSGARAVVYVRRSETHRRRPHPCQVVQISQDVVSGRGPPATLYPRLISTCRL